jgi:hypothetical protein
MYPPPTPGLLLAKAEKENISSTATNPTFFIAASDL